MKKTTIFLTAISVIAFLAIGFYTLQSLKQPTTGFAQYDIETQNLVGSGYSIGGGITSTTSKPTLFQFNSSTDTTYWDTDKFAYPHYYGATTTAFFSTRGAELITLNFYWKPRISASKLDYTLYYSNDSGCNQASSTLNTAVWYPLPLVLSTTTPSINTGTSGNTITGLTATTTWGITLDNINYDCLKATFYNSSSSDPSYLKVDATFKIKK